MPGTVVSVRRLLLAVLLVVLAGCGLTCLVVWRQRDSARTAAGLTVTGLAAFVLSHVLGRVIGAWPAVLVVSALTAAACWRWSDSRRDPQRVSPAASG